MKKCNLIALFCIILISCKETKEEMQLPAEKLYLVAYNQYAPEETSETEATPLIFYVKGVTELSKDFNLKITRTGKWIDSDYHFDNFILSDSIKTSISYLVTKYPNDTSFWGNKELEYVLYDGFFYFIYIKKADGNNTFLDLGIPHYNDNEDARYLFDKLYGAYETDTLKKNIANQDSIKNLFSGFIKCLPDSMIQDPIPPRKAVKFIPPVIEADND